MSGTRQHGFSLSSALSLRAGRSKAGAATLQHGAVGGHLQLGQVVSGRLEPVVRYAFLLPTSGDGAQHDVALGFNLFLRGHALKWQTAVGARVRGDRPGAAPELRLQSQLSLTL